jgi:hypothetical protein
MQGVQRKALGSVLCILEVNKSSNEMRPKMPRESYACVHASASRWDPTLTPSVPGK